MNNDNFNENIGVNNNNFQNYNDGNDMNNGNFGNNYNMINNKQTNGMAIAGFVCSFLIPLVGLILSIIGLKKSKILNDGKGLSTAIL